MGAHAILFSEPQLNTRIRTVASGLRDANTGSSAVENSHSRLGIALGIISQNPELFDKHCQFNIGRVGNGFASLINEAGFSLGQNNINRLNIYVLRFVCEYDLALGSDLPIELGAFVEGVFADCDNYGPDLKGQIDYVQQRMPVAILKTLLNSEEFGNLRDVQAISQATNDRVETWQTEIAASEGRVRELQSTLENQRTEYNFVGLSKGFSDLESIIKDELRKSQRRLLFFGCLVLIPIILEFASINFKWVDVAAVNPVTLLIGAVSSVTATLLLLYFFRITLRDADACKAQLGQVRLRMTLCRFIQSYADYSTEIKEKNSEALSKFENLIFSGIVSSDDKLPSTFDGMDQLSGLLKAIRGNDK